MCLSKAKQSKAKHDRLNRPYRFGIFFLFLFLISPNTHANIREGLVGWWKLDETSGATAIDWSGQNNNGTYNGTTVLPASQCKRSGCRYFNGASDYIDAGSGASLRVTGAITISAWAATTSTSSQNILGERGGAGGGYQLLLKGSGGNYALRFTYFDVNDWDSNNNMYSPDGQWHHYAVVNNLSTVSFYKDGVLFSTSGGGSTGTSGDSPMQLGAFYFLTRGSYFNGSLDDVRIYNRAISAQEVSDLFRAGTLIRNAKISNARFNQ